MTLLSSPTIWLRPLVRRSTVWRSKSKEVGAGGVDAGGGSVFGASIGDAGIAGRCSGEGSNGAFITGGLCSVGSFVSSTALMSIIKSLFWFDLFNDSTI